MTKNFTINQVSNVSLFGRTEDSNLKSLVIYFEYNDSKIVLENEIPGDGLANAAHVFTNRGIQALRTRHLLFGPQMRNIPITHVRIFAHRNKLRCLVSRQTRANLGENYV